MSAIAIDVSIESYAMVSVSALSSDSTAEICTNR